MTRRWPTTAPRPRPVHGPVRPRRWRRRAVVLSAIVHLSLIGGLRFAEPEPTIVRLPAPERAIQIEIVSVSGEDALPSPPLSLPRPPTPTATPPGARPPAPPAPEVARPPAPPAPDDARPPAPPA
ncbi:MAG: hypothetical protein AAF318_06220, partial [Pseudomonadota bacterium]